MGDGVLLSRNNGDAWQMVNNGLPKSDNGGQLYDIVNSVAVTGTNVFAGTQTNGVYFSTNSGDSWQAETTGIVGRGFTVREAAIFGDNVFAGGLIGNRYSRVFLSNNNGATWQALNTCSGCGFLVATIGSNIFLGGIGGVSLSIDGGASWQPVNYGLVDILVTALASCGAGLFAGTYSGIYRSSNSGASWQAVNAGLATDRYTTDFVVEGDEIFCALDSGGVFLSTKNGVSWSPIGTGLKSVQCLAMSKQYLFAGTMPGLWRFPLAQIASARYANQPNRAMKRRVRIVSSADSHSGISLIYDIGSTCDVRFGIYAVSGGRVALLENGLRTAGVHCVKFHGSGFPQSLFVYRFQAGSYQESGRFTPTPARERFQFSTNSGS